MLQPQNETRAGVASPATGQTENQRENSNKAHADLQLITRDALWEICSIFTACGVAAMAAAGGGSLEVIEADLQSARLALLDAISTFKELRALYTGAAAT